MSLNPLEKKAALALKPYFSKLPTVVDIGSNKGFWSDILVHNVSDIHLFEPNQRLLTYTMVKYDYLKNVHYYPYAVANESKKDVDFFYFTNENNGLSSILYNQFWVDQGLPMQTGKVNQVTLDEMFSTDIDFIKIDVEGADFLVLMGAKNLLKEKKIKFIQFENSAHLNLAGHTLADVITFVQGFGYDVFYFDGDNFVKYSNQESENLYIMDKDFTQDWNGQFKKNTELLKGMVQFALEIGAFEGLTSTYICDNLLKDKDSRMIVIDPLTDEYLPGHEDNALFVGQYDRFIRNTRTYPIELVRTTSDKAFKQPGFKDYRFDFIYIDGDHRREQVYQDGVNSFHCCRIGGHILFDDYEWREETKLGIDQFLRDYGHCLEVVVKGYQVMIRKTKDQN